MEIKKPIFIIGTGRSGTTIFYNLISMHPELCWFSNISDKLPRARFLPLLHRTLDLPVIGALARKRILTRKKLKVSPVEAGNIYHNYCKFEHKKKTTEQDRVPGLEEKFKEIIEAHLFYTGKRRFLSKQTANNQRISLIDSMFKDAYYIHIIRDGRAVAHSLLNVRWWGRLDFWWLEEMEKSSLNMPDLKLSALHWKRTIEEILSNRNKFQDRYIEIKYEEFVQDVRGTMDWILSFCDLDYSAQFFELLPEKLSSMNHKWKENLSNEQKQILHETLHPLLNRLGYE